MMDDVKDRLLTWYRSGDTGVSSKAIAAHLMGEAVDRVFDCHPYDPSDLGRCLRLLALIPEWRPRIREMAALDGAWPEMVEIWDDLEAVFLKECGGRLLAKGEGAGVSCPQTYEMMQNARARATARRHGAAA